MPHITVCTKPGCVQCDATLKALDRLALAYRRVGLSADEQARDYVLSLGHLQAPVIVTPAGSWSGFRPDLIAGLVAA